MRKCIREGCLCSSGNLKLGCPYFILLPSSGGFDGVESITHEPAPEIPDTKPIPVKYTPPGQGPVCIRPVLAK